MKMPSWKKWLDLDQPASKGWVLKKDAPPEVVKEFEKYMKERAEARKKGVIID